MTSLPAVLCLENDVAETEEALSLSNSPTAHSAPQPAPPFASDEPFEFSSASNDNISHAEDIFFCGKLIPLRQKLSDQTRDQTRDPSCDRSHEQSRARPHDCNGLCVTTREKEEREKGCRGRRLPSDVKYATQPNSPESKYMRISKALDYQQLRRSLSSDCRLVGIRRHSSARSSGRSDNSGEKVNKPRWYSMLFGLVSKVPPEMDLRDMKNRFVRRTPSTMFPQSANRSQRWSSWGFLEMLSCNDNASIGVATSFGYMSRVNRCDTTYSHATCTRVVRECDEGGVHAMP